MSFKKSDLQKQGISNSRVEKPSWKIKLRLQRHKTELSQIMTS